MDDDDEPRSVRQGTPSAGHKVPAPKRPFGPAAWVPAGHNISFGDWVLPGGLFYFGVPSPDAAKSLLAGLVNPELKLRLTREDLRASSGLRYGSGYGYGYSFGGMYEPPPGYAGCSPDDRRSYLNWLASGRRDRNAPSFCLRLFLSGLEHRVLVDTQDNATSAAAFADLPFILEELWRLAEVYGELEVPYLLERLIEVVTLFDAPARSYEHPLPPMVSRMDSVPPYLRLALAHCARDKAPVPSHLALAYVRSCTFLRTPAQRCPQQFEQLFAVRYREKFGQGLPVAKSRSLFTFSYQAVNSWLGDGFEKTYSFGQAHEASHASILAAAQELAEGVTQELDAFSRFVGSRKPKDVPDAHLLLPLVVWPDQPRAAITHLANSAAQEPVAMRWGDLLQAVGVQETCGKNIAHSLAQALAAVGIGIEPDLLAGAKAPSLEEHVALFASGGGVAVVQRKSVHHQQMCALLRVLSAVALADSPLSAQETARFGRLIDHWAGDPRVDRQRLRAMLTVFERTPPALTGMKAVLATFADDLLPTLAHAAVLMALCDGEANPQEISVLEKVYKLLGQDVQRLYSDLHAGPAGVKAAAARASAGSTFELDAQRIAALQEESRKSAVLLADIFSGDDEAGAKPQAAVSTAAATSPTRASTAPRKAARAADAPLGLAGLDKPHAQFVRRLLGRDSWRREDLLHMASSLDLMLDGALEHINEACFDAYDQPLTEGDEFVSISAELIHRDRTHQFNER